MPKVSVLIADDSLAQRMMLNAILSAHEHIEVVGQAKDGQEALALFQSLSPDIIILDLVMPNVDGKEALTKIIAADNTAKVIIASSLGGEESIEECLKIGASNYIQKPYEEDDLIKAISVLTA